MKHIKRVIVAIIILIVLILVSKVKAERSIWTEDYYNSRWCAQYEGQREYRLPNKKRVDCLLPEYAVEADWANYKAYEAIGQSLYYAKETNRKPAILLIIKDIDGFEWVQLTKETLAHYDIDAKVFFIIAYEKFNNNP